MQDRSQAGPLVDVIASKAIGKNVNLYLRCGHTKKFRGKGVMPKRSRCLPCAERTDQ